MILDIIGLEKDEEYRSQAAVDKNIVTIVYGESPPVVCLTVSHTVS